MDYYQLLGVPRDATEDQIKVAYRKAAMECHPDRNKGDKAAEEKFKKLNEAYDTLKDRQKRAAYDRPQQPHFDPFADFGFTSSFRHPNGPGGMGAFDFDDLLRQFHYRSAQARNQDLTVQYQMTLEDAFRGTVTNIRFTAPDGRPRDVVVSIPKGVDNGHRIKVDGAGDRSLGNFPPGDLYVLIAIKPHAIFTRTAQNLQCEHAISVFDAMVGTTIEVPTIDGTTVRINVPAGIQPGDKLRVPQKGMSTLGTSVRGDLYVNVRLTVPRGLSEAQKDKVREIRKLIFGENVQQ